MTMKMIGRDDLLIYTYILLTTKISTLQIKMKVITLTLIKGVQITKSAIVLPMS